MAGRILIVDDESNHRLMMKLHLEDSGYKTEEASNGAEALIKLDDFEPDVILLDMKMDIMDGLTFLTHVSRRGLAVPVIVITAFSSVKTAVEAMKLGAADYLTKPVDIEHMLETVAKTLTEKTVIPPLEYAEEYGFEGVYSADGLGKIIEQLKMVAPLNATVLVLGESGTGKELIARSIHTNSPRKNKPFIAVNCAALNENLIESELFGHMKGSFTGASSNKEGRFELADGGTIFLDEIGELPPQVQAKLLRVLQDRTFERVGGIRTVTTDARIVAATNKDLKTLSEKGEFREDLYFRLSVFPVNLPPLRERTQEIEPLVNYFISKYAQRFGKLIKGAERNYIDKLKKYSFPGNIRELENIVERSVILSKSERLTPDTLPPLEIKNGCGSLDMRDNEKDLIIKALEKTGGNKTKAAEVLGISRRTLHSKINEFGIK
ncbi:sigma-54-dependent Fis family transcriptional regulator [Geovibrio thiophilus]|uniref:Sigma-54-dependent Fis family transcriptional regulator n=1 Tax=Geovibrio thiophilus TaxID=139438 RepID=A0A3R5Y7I2_9BACT|nr:sigma-54 dependent transcriptional regulator [Geovibrio thiophilus]QAR33605.1 sigma-54-dependent Fis family transcriptional regulator [Geovibrio thiophilus]